MDQFVRGPIDDEFTPRPNKPQVGISRQTLAFISASHRQGRTSEARRTSAEMASRNYYRETGRPLFIDSTGAAWRPEDLTKEVRERFGNGA